MSSFLSGVSPQHTNLSSSRRGEGAADPLSRPLFIVWAGANDVFFNPNVSAAQSYLEIASVAAALSAAYPAARVLTVASPDLSRLPYGFYADEITKTQLRSFTDLLAVLLENGQAHHVDLRGLFDEFEYFALPVQYGFAPLGKYGSCVVGVYGEGTGNGTITECSDAEERVYWDEYQLSLPNTFLVLLLAPMRFLNVETGGKKGEEANEKNVCTMLSPTTHTHSWIAQTIHDALS